MEMKGTEIMMRLAVVAAILPAMSAFAADSVFERYSFANVEKPVYYTATGPIEKGSASKLAVVHIHGWGGGFHVSKEEVPMFNALREAMGNDAVAPYVISPLFPRKGIFKKAKVQLDNRAVWNSSWSTSLKIPGSRHDDWRGGGDADGTHMSSYDIVDSVLAALGDRSRFPNLRRVVLTGYSAGGQFVGRYVAVGKGVVRDGVELVYAAMAPSSELRLDRDVRWHYGLKDRPRYSAQMTYEQILKNLSSRRVWRECGTADTKVAPFTPLDSCSEAMAQGGNRYERFRNFEQYLKQFPEWAKQVSFYSLEGVGHENAVVHSSRPFIEFAVGDVAGKGK